MSVLWTKTEVVAATGGKAVGTWPNNGAINGVSIDTRTLQPGDLFVALKDVRDGHDFVASALKAGAAAALVSHVPEGIDKDAPLLIVGDVLAALEDMARVARARTEARIVAVTGSVGKTSTKEMLRVVLARQGKTHVAEASYNNQWGVPLTLARMPKDTEFGVIEIGMNHAGEIAPLTKMTRPHVVMITTVAAAHLEAFENIESIAIEKASIMDGLEPGGVAVLNADTYTAAILVAKSIDVRVRSILFGEAGEEYQLKGISLSDDATIVQTEVNGAAGVFKISTAGRHFAMNGLGVLAVVEALGLDPAIAAIDLADWQPPAGRGTREAIFLDRGDSDQVLHLIDDAFNANPASMEAALEVLAAAKPQDGLGRIEKGRRIAILGDMLELGSGELMAHAGLADLPFIADLSVVHCVGPLMRHLWQALPAAQQGVWVASADEIAPNLHNLVDAGDVVLIKGSKGIKVSALVDVLRKLGHPANKLQNKDS